MSPRSRNSAICTSVAPAEGDRGARRSDRACPAKPIDPITLQVINGALQTIAEEMGHVLYRMSFSSIIRESQDLGAGLFDTDFNTLCESESTPLHIGSLPGYLAGIQRDLAGRRMARGRSRHPQSSLSRLEPFAGHRRRGAGFPRRDAGRILRQHRAPPRYRRGDAGTDHRHSRRLRRGHAVCRHQALRARQAQRGDVELSSAATAAPRGSCRTTSTRRSPRRGSAPSASSS